MKTFLICFILCLNTISQAQNSESEKQVKKFNLTSEGVAVDGYDVVNYFKTGPKEGSKSFSTSRNGAIYYFSSKENLDLFKNSPEKYLPVYGGWCAFAMGNSGEKVEINPETYKIIEQKLYLFYNAYFTNTLIKWNKDEKNLKSKADLNWIKIVK